jgi:hypothetical protein
MKKPILAHVFTLLIFALPMLTLFISPAAKSDDTSSLSNSHLSDRRLSDHHLGIRNRVFFENLKIQAGDTVLVQPVDMIAHSAFKTPIEISQGNELSKYRDHKYLNPYRMTHIVRTWLDYRKLLFEFAKKENIEIHSQETRERVAAKMYEVTGIRPLRNNQVLVGMNSTLESIYDIKELAFMKNITSDFFRLGENVIYTAHINGGSFQQEGTVAGIRSDGSILVQRGMHFTRVYPEDLFSTERNYNQQFKLKEDVIYKFKRVSGNLVTQENGKVAAVSPEGDIIIYVNKLSQLIKIRTKNSTMNAVICGNLFI